MTPAQMQAARALLGRSLTHLAARSVTSAHIVKTYERTGWITLLHGQNRMEQIDDLAALRTIFEAFCVEFKSEDTPEVRLQGKLHQ